MEENIMKTSRFSCAVLIFVSLMICALAGVPALAKDGRDFAGFYNVSNVVEQGDQMVITVRVQVFNNSDADVKQAVLTLRQNPGPALGTFPSVKLWRNHGEVRLTQQFVVPKHEFEQWHKGTQPALMVVTHDSTGQRYDRYVQLSSRPALPR
jgi:hypothetical protein